MVPGVSAVALAFALQNIVTTDSGLSYHMWIAEMAPNGTDVDAGAGSCGKLFLQAELRVPP